MSSADSTTTTAPPRRGISALGEKLRLKSEPVDEGAWRLNLVVKRPNGTYAKRSGRAAACFVRDIAVLHAARAQAQKAKATKLPPLAPSPVKMRKLIEGEQSAKKMPTAPLAKGWRGWCIRKGAWSVATILDFLAWYLRDIKLKEKVGPFVLGYGILMLLCVVPGYFYLDHLVNTTRQHHISGLMIMVKFARFAFPLLLLAFGLVCVPAGISAIKDGRSFKSLLEHWHNPQPAWREQPVFKIGGVNLLLKSLHEGMICFGGVGSGKTVSFVAPLLLQLLRKLNNPNPNALDARFGGLFLDVKGNFTDLVVYMMIQVGRPLSDLVLIDTDMDLFRYNPLDPYDPRFAQNGAAKLSSVNKIMGNESKGDNVYWNDQTILVIRYILQTLEIIRPKNRIGLDDVARFSRDDDRVAALVTQAQKVLEQKRRTNKISPDSYAEYSGAVAELLNNWHRLDGRTKTILKTTLAQMLGPLASDPVLVRIFCRDTNFSFRDVINEGKIVLFRGRSIDNQASRLIAVCLKRDLQTWVRRRYGTAAAEFGLNTARTIVFLADEYQEVVTCGGEGDESFTGVCREAKCAYLVATQLKSSLDVAIKNPAQLDMLIGNLNTKIFFKLSDKATQELGSFFGGKHYRERERASVYHTSMLSSLAGGVKSAQRDYHSQVDTQLEDVFRPDEFSRLRTVDKLKSADGPWFSEAFIYNYSETDTELISWMEKTKLSHLYPPRDEMVAASLLFDDLLYARNAQSRIQRMFWLLAAAGARERKVAAERMAAQSAALQDKITQRGLGHAGNPRQSLYKNQEMQEANLEQVKKLHAEAAKDLRNYELSKGKHGPQYLTLKTRYDSLTTQLNIAYVTVGSATSPYSSPISLATPQAAMKLLHGRSLDTVIKAGIKDGIPERIAVITDAAQVGGEIARGMQVKPSVPDAAMHQASAIEAPKRPTPVTQVAPAIPATVPVVPAANEPAAVEVATTGGDQRASATSQEDSLRSMSAHVENIVQQAVESGYSRQVRTARAAAPADADITTAYPNHFPKSDGNATGTPTPKTIEPIPSVMLDPKDSPEVHAEKTNSLLDEYKDLYS